MSDKPVYRPRWQVYLATALLWLIILSSIYGIYWLWNG